MPSSRNFWQKSVFLIIVPGWTGKSPTRTSILTHGLLLCAGVPRRGRGGLPVAGGRWQHALRGLEGNTGLIRLLIKMWTGPEPSKWVDPQPSSPSDGIYHAVNPGVLMHKSPRVVVLSK